jgi:hypothetical protein
MKIFLRKISDHDYPAEKCKNLKPLNCQISGNKDQIGFFIFLSQFREKILSEKILRFFFTMKKNFRKFRHFKKFF